MSEPRANPKLKYFKIFYLVSGFGPISLWSSLIWKQREDEENDGSDQEPLENHFGDWMNITTAPRRKKVLSDNEAGQGDVKVELGEGESGVRVGAGVCDS